MRKTWLLSGVAGALAVGAVLPAAALGAATPGTVATGTSRPADPMEAGLRFTLSPPADLPITSKVVTVTLWCDDGEGEVAVATAELRAPEQTEIELPSPQSNGMCQVTADLAAGNGRTDEVTVTVRSDPTGLLDRRLHYLNGPADNGVRTATSGAFPAPEGSGLSIDVAAGDLPDDEVGTALKLMTFNIWQGGRLDPAQADGWGEENLAELAEFVRIEDPDVLFLVETYGAGKEVEAALNADRTDGRSFTGVQITREPGQAPDRDNLWLFTHLDVEQVYPRLGDGDLTSFNFGGARLRLPGGAAVHAFTTWLHHTDNARAHANRAAAESVLGLCRYHSEDEIVGTDERRRREMATTLLRDRLDRFVGDDTAPVLIGGDFNTMSHLDWSERFAGAPGHGGLVLDWPVLRMFDEAGFTDTYRQAYPDAARYPGSTMDPARGELFAPGRIDYLLTRGEQVRVLAASTRTERATPHRGSVLDDRFPFYSDHAAVVAEVLIRGTGTGPDPDRPAVFDDPLGPDELDPAWPEPPVGVPVPADELTATASTEREFFEAGRAVDGDVRTSWRSRIDPVPDRLPHVLTIDMGRERDLSALRYQPPFDTAIGTVLRAGIEVGTDGTEFEEVARVRWSRDRLPEDLELGGVRARYLRLTIEHSSGGDVSAAAQITPYEIGADTAPTSGAPGTTDDWPPDGEPDGEPDDAVTVSTQTFRSDCARVYTETGDWISSNLPGRDGTLTRYSNVDGSTAGWTPELPASGAYEVAIWWPEHQTTTTAARYTIEHASGLDQVVIDPRERMGDWHVLGAWEFVEGDSGRVELTVGSGYHRTDAVRFRPLGTHSGP